MNKRTHTFLLYWLPPLAWATVIFVQSSFPAAVPSPASFELSDKFLHLVVYAALAWLLVWALVGAQKMSPMRAACWAFVIAALYGASDELHQGLVPSRTMEWGDWFADVIGAATAFLAVPVVHVLQRFRGTSAASSG